MSAALMFRTAVRTEQRALRRNPLLFVNAALVPVSLLVITLGTSRAAPTQVEPLVWGVVLTALWGSTVWMAGGVLRRERTSGTLGRVVTGSHAPFLVLTAKSTGATLYAAAVIVVSSALTVLALGVPVRLGDPAVIVVAAVLLVVSGSALGTLLACLFLVTRHGLEWSSTLIYPVFLLGGLLIPTDRLAVWLRWVPDVLSLHWVHQLLVTSSRGQGFDAVAAGVAAGLSVVYGLLAWWALRWAVDRARRQATLDLV